MDIQEDLFRYRCGLWEFNARHTCARVNGGFHRGHEECECFGLPDDLSVRDYRAMRKARESVSERARFTRVDYMLNTHQFDRAMARLKVVRAKLRREHYIQVAGTEADEGGGVYRS